MKSRFVFLLLLSALIASCAPQTATEPPSIIFERPTRTPSEMSPAETAVVDQLANNLGLDSDDISVASNAAVEFGDSCMDVTMEGVICAEVITPGRVIVLESNGIQYEYHVSEDGSRIQPATLALTWRREGGFAGFCDSMTVFLSGEIYGNQCKTQPNEAMGVFSELLTAEEREQIDIWTTDYGQATLDQSDPKGTVDGMVNIVELFGLEAGKPVKTVQEDIFIWAQTVYQKLYS